MTEFNPATMNPAAIILPNNLDNSSDNILEILILLIFITIIILIFIKNNSK
jgi:hypothetical protein